MDTKDRQHLQWIYDRMVQVHNENQDYDYMIKFRSILKTMANIEKIIKDIIEDNKMRLQTPTGKSNTEYYQTKIDVCNQILEKVRRENAQSENSNCTIPDVMQQSIQGCPKTFIK